MNPEDDRGREYLLTVQSTTPFQIGEAVDLYGTTLFVVHIETGSVMTVRHLTRFETLTLKLRSRVQSLTLNLRSRLRQHRHVRIRAVIKEKK